MLADTATPEALAERLAAVREVVAFAEELGLSVDGQYTSYVAWDGDRVITTLVATRPGEIEPTPFWFPLIGHAPYKGFFDPERAAREAEALAADGYDTCLFPILAYSTLGWFDDPLNGPMLQQSPERLAETVLHELVHATVFVPSQPDFNEGLATFVGQEAAVRFAGRRVPAREAQAEGDRDAEQRERTRVSEDREVAAVLGRFRTRVAALYASDTPTEAARAELETEARRELAALPLETRDAGRLAEAVRLNDACQALTGTYHADLPRWQSILEAGGGDLPGLIARIREAAEEDDPRSALFGPEPAAP